MNKYYKHVAHGLHILYEDRDILVIDKPAGLLSIASGGEREKTAYWILSEYLRKKGEKKRPACVHRLDRDTSGLMIFAKSEIIKKKLMNNWDALVTERRYIALAEGDIRDKGGELKDGSGTNEPNWGGVIDAPLGEDAGGRVIVQQGGKRALTRWKLIKPAGNFSLVSLELETGRRNQIRAHLAHIGHPVAGDKKYRAKTDPLKRLCLHAETIVFYHPKTGKIQSFTVPGPFKFPDK